VLVAMPVLLFVYSYFVNYDYVSLLWTTFFGIVMSIGGLISMTIGIFWMRSIVNIEV
jgi:tight adherence protein B